jgi:hypothetical protein
VTKERFDIHRPDLKHVSTSYAERNTGNRLAPGDEPPSARRHPALNRHRAGAWGRFLVLLLRGRRDCAIDLLQRRELHGCHGFRDGITNLVLELSIILIVLMGWQFMAAEAIRRTDHGRDSPLHGLFLHRHVQIVLTAHDGHS